MNRSPLFSYGFRPFFLLASLAGGSFVTAWVGRLFFPRIVSSGRVDMGWHAHEMFFGFTMAMVAGFLLTAVPNWTSSEPRKGNSLVLLSLLWMLGRLSMFFPQWRWMSVFDLAFIPALLGLVVPALWQRRTMKTFLFVPILVGLWTGNLLYYLQQWGAGDVWGIGVWVSLTGILLLLVIIGGRVVPFFTSKALSSSPQKWKPIEALAILTILSLPFVGYLPDWALWLWTFTMFSTHSLRIWGWYHPGIWKVPLLWVLFLGFAWLPIGGALLGLGYLGVAPVSAGIHAFTSGTIGIVGIGIMARASLGHTGRPLKAPSTVVLAFGLVACGSVVRVFGPLAGVSYSLYLIGGGSLWSLGYLLFFLTYLPILTGPRADAGLS